MRGIIIGMSLAIALLVCSCAGRGKGLELGGTHIPLQGITLSEQAMGAHQRFEIKRMDGSFQFDGYVESEPDRLVIIGFTPMGSRAFSLTLENGTLTWDSIPFYRLPISPEDLLSAWQAAFGPQNLLQHHLTDTKTRLETGADRRFIKGNRLITLVTYENPNPWQGSVEVRHLTRGYRVIIETRSTERFE